MKQLTCEMCGGTDLVKQDGMFVCQSCGTKYSTEEAKKMMVEGTVCVQGTVKIDNSEAYANYMQLAKDAFEDSRFDSAYTAIIEALKTTPEDPLLIERQALVILGRESFVQNIPSATTKGMERAVQIAEKKCSVDELFVFAETMLSDIDVVIKYLRNGFHDEITELNAQMMPMRSPMDILADLGRPEFVAAQNARDDKIKAQHNSKIDAQIAVVKGKISTLDSFWEQYSKIASGLKERAQKRKNTFYWEEHSEDKTSLENERNQLTKERSEIESIIAELEEKKDRVPAKTDWEAVKEKRRSLIAQKDSLSLLFKWKEKKALQEQIDSLHKESLELWDVVGSQQSEIDTEISPLRKKLSEVHNRINAIYIELNKDR